MSDDQAPGTAGDPSRGPVEPFASPSGPHAPPPAPPPADRWAPPDPGTPPAYGQPAPYGQPPSYEQAPVYGQAPAYAQGPAYGQGPFDPSGQVVPYYAGPGPFARAHGRATTALVLGIISVVCGVLCFCTYGVSLIGSLGAPFAIWLGLSARREIDASPGAYSNRGVAVAGFVTGIVGTALLVIDLVLIVLVFVFALGGGFTT